MSGHLLNFQARFVPRIESGLKTHTIRAFRKRAIWKGDMLHLYTGLRHPGARLLMRVPCAGVDEIEITEDGTVLIAGMRLNHSERRLLAERDGFQDFSDMFHFWLHPKNRLPFHGQIIHWREDGKR